MLEIKDTQGPVLSLHVGGKLQADDYKRLVPAFDKLVRDRDTPMPMRIELGADFSGWSLDGLWRELKFDVTNRACFGPVAVIGDTRWQRWGTALSSPFFKAPVRFFERKDAAQADAWLLAQLAAAGSH